LQGDPSRNTCEAGNRKQGGAGSVKCKDCNANFKNFSCNLSILLIWTPPEGFQIKEAYSTLERTKAEYKDNLEYGSLNNKVFRLTKQKIA